MPDARRLLSVLCLAPTLLTACVAFDAAAPDDRAASELAPVLAAPVEDDEPGSDEDEPAPIVTDVCGAVAGEPAGSFTFEELVGVEAHPVDVFAEERVYEITPPGKPTEYVRTLVIAFGEATQECAHRERGVALQQMNEVRLLVSQTSKTDVPEPILAGTYASDLWAEEEAGERCVLPGVERASSDTALVARKVTGTVTISRRTDSTVEGTFEVTDPRGEVTLRGSFSAPICKTPEVTRPACCAS